MDKGQAEKLSWQERARAKVADVRSRIPKEWVLDDAVVRQAKETRAIAGPFFERFLNSEDIKIMRLDTVPLAAKIASGELSAVAVATTYSKMACIALQIGNCIHELCIDQALERAKELDEYYAKNGKTIGPMHGVPVSLKDQFNIKGLDSTNGYVGWIDTHEGDPNSPLKHKIESLMVKELLSLGAILYCKLGETKNNIIGSTMNPHNHNVSCGGSSGGEGAMIALRASNVGIGTDMAGSVRIPAGFCGLYGIKPTHNRFPYKDVATFRPGQMIYPPTVGFLSSSVDGLALIMESLLSTKPWLQDPEVVPIPWRPEMVNEILVRAKPDGSPTAGGKPLKIAIHWTDNIVAPHPPITRGMKIVDQVLRGAGHKTFAWDPPDHNRGRALHMNILRAAGSAGVYKNLDLSGEPLMPDAEPMFRPLDPLNVPQFNQLAMEGVEYTIEYSDYWNGTADKDGQVVDAVIMPVAPHAAVLPQRFVHGAYCTVVNMLDFSSAVIPVTKADKGQDQPDTGRKPYNDLDKYNYGEYNADLYHGAPVGVQVVTRKHEEEKAYAVAKIISNALRTAGYPEERSNSNL